MSDNGTLKINDFDHAVLSGSTLRFSTTSRLGGGTMRWMVGSALSTHAHSNKNKKAPELYEAEDEDGGSDSQVMRNRATDIYALAMVCSTVFLYRR